MYIGLSFPLLEFREKDSFANATWSTPFVRTAPIESLHLSFFYSRFMNPYCFVGFRKTGFGSGLPIFNSRGSLNLKVVT